ncbi:hypothetical protein EYZ11_012781 [Aspergillus tanneri]|uniref:Uncharacterized protein n=1 Tax=Aspergillus tanneri TaxID=1220188 RepID=A0A4V3UMM2_9EURO|nr:hypothetical protein EYZ11_012781 [Aspergillus tanneri]
MEQITTITQIPSNLTRLDLPSSPRITQTITPTDGLVILTRVISAPPPQNLIEHPTDLLGPITESDILPSFSAGTPPSVASTARYPPHSPRGIQSPCSA